MITFIAALLNDAGEVVAVTTSDSPIRADQPPIGGCRMVSIGAAIARPVEGAPVDMPPLATAALHEHIEVAADGTLRLADTGRAQIETMMHGPATDADLTAADTLHPLVAHWLTRRLHAAHPLRAKAAAEAAARPILADRAARLHAQRFDPHGTAPVKKALP